MGETMYDCFLSQFHCMKKVLDNRKKILGTAAEFFLSKMPDRVYLIGSGTSYNACNAAAYFMEQILKREITVIAPSCVEKLYGKTPIAIVVSQGGRSTNTIDAIEKIHRQNIPVITLSDPADTPVGKAGDFPALLAAEMELVGPKTRGYAVTILSLYLLALEVARYEKSILEEDLKKYHDSFENMILSGEKWIDLCQEFYRENREDLMEASHYIFAGKGVGGKVAQEAALKVLETLCFAANGYEYEEFLHGPACCTDEKLALFLYLTNDEDQKRIIQTAEIIRKASVNCYIISHDRSVLGEKILFLPDSEEYYLSPFSDILFAQLISARLTEDMGRTRHPAVKNIFQDMGTKIPFPEK